ncbi:molybdopterin molybdotransferase MoeA [Leifsonia sp. YIM 134122]|uniref:Molybdopterin molybdenumtransferase n=1 Tax=Leifsonia stereocauli TaxID=3134136 RepID=A0ABU9W336_9MICO
MSSASPSWDDARARAVSLGAERMLPSRPAAISEAVGLTSAADAHAVVSLPIADISAMDGWAIAGDGPWRVGEPVRMGADTPSEELRPGLARPVTTGAVVPPGARAVLRSEHGATERDPAGAELLSLNGSGRAASDQPAGRHIRRAGEEITAGELLWAAGTILTPAHVAFGAVAGLDTLEVRPLARARLVVTGDEVITVGAPRRGEVRDAFTPVFSSLLPMLGLSLHSGHHASDSHAAVSEALQHPDEAELVITTGGTSRGSGDWVRHAVEDSGGVIVVDGVRMRPGHPVLLARLADGRPLLALPGNPLAALVCLLSFAPALVAGMTGGALSQLEPLLELDVEPIEHDTRIIPFHRENGRAVATSWRGSAMLRGLSEAEGLAVVAPQDAPAPTLMLPLPWALAARR